jgi:hypothetical protein
MSENAESKFSGTLESIEKHKEKTALNWPTLILILITGGSNFFATVRGNLYNRSELDRARQQIREVHDYLAQSTERQKKLLEDVDSSLSKQIEMLQNQERMLENQSKGLID